MITPLSMLMVERFEASRHAHAASGASLWGPDLSAWPARDFDVLVALEHERIKEHNARIEAEQRES